MTWHNLQFPDLPAPKLEGTIALLFSDLKACFVGLNPFSHLESRSKVSTLGALCNQWPTRVLHKFLDPTVSQRHIFYVNHWYFQFWYACQSWISFSFSLSLSLINSHHVLGKKTHLHTFSKCLVFGKATYKCFTWFGLKRNNTLKVWNNSQIF